MGVYISEYFMFRYIQYTLRKSVRKENMSAIEKVNLIQNAHLKESKPQRLPLMLN